MDEKKKEQLREILFSPLQDFHGKRRYLQILFTILLANFIYCFYVFADRRLPQEPFPISQLFLISVLLLVGILILKYGKTTKDDKNDQKSRS